MPLVKDSISREILQRAQTLVDVVVEFMISL